jgi:hypothetical protein
MPGLARAALDPGTLRRVPALGMSHAPSLPRKRKASPGLRPPLAERTLGVGDWEVLDTALNTPNLATARLHGAGILTPLDGKSCRKTGLGGQHATRRFGL